MLFRIISKFLVLLLVSGLFSSKRLQNCLEVDSLIKQRISEDQYDKAYVVA